MTPDQMVERLINFAARVGKVVDALPDTRMGRHIGGQLVRSGTSPAPNYEEACAAESRADFVHKLSICLKELRESRSWIRLIITTEMLAEHRMGELLDECSQFCNMIAQSSPQKKTERRTVMPDEHATECSGAPSNLQFAICIFQFSICMS